MSIPEQRTHLSWHSRQWTRIGSISLSIRASMGGLRSEDRSFRADWTAFSCTTGSSLAALATSCSRFVVARLLSKSSSSETSADYDLAMPRFSTHYTMTNQAQYNPSQIITLVVAWTLYPKFNTKILGQKKKWNNINMQVSITTKLSPDQYIATDTHTNTLLTVLQPDMVKISNKLCTNLWSLLLGHSVASAMSLLSYFFWARLWPHFSAFSFPANRKTNLIIVLKKKKGTLSRVCPVTDFYRNVSSYQKFIIKILNETK